MTMTRLARAATLVAIFGLVSRFLGLVRNQVLIGGYGASGEGDAFVNGLVIVNLLAAVVLYTLVTVVIPLFQRERVDHGEDSAWRLVWVIAAWTSLVLMVVAVVAEIWPQLPAAAFPLDPARAEMTTNLIRIMAPALLFQGISALFTALLQIHGRFGTPAAVGMAFNAGIIGGILVGRNHLGIEAAAWGVVVGGALQVALQLPQFVRVMGGHRVGFSLTHPRLRHTGMLMLPVVAASVLQQINGITDRIFASTLEEGRVIALEAANSLGAAPRTALLVPFLTPLFPVVANMMAEGRSQEAARGVHRVTGLLGLVGVPASVLLALYARETTQLLFGNGRCDAACVDETAKPLVWYALALLLNFLSIFLNRVLAADNRQSDVLVATIATVGVTIALDAALIGPMEQSGLALASGIGVGLNLAIYLAYLRRRLPEFSLVGLVRQQARLITCGVGAVAAGLAMNRLVDTGTLSGWDLVAPFFAKLGVCVAVYLVLARMACPADLREAVSAVRALGRRRPKAA